MTNAQAIDNEQVLRDASVPAAKFLDKWQARLAEAGTPVPFALAAAVRQAQREITKANAFALDLAAAKADLRSAEKALRAWVKATF